MDRGQHPDRMTMRRDSQYSRRMEQRIHRTRKLMEKFAATKKASAEKRGKTSIDMPIQRSQRRENDIARPPRETDDYDTLTRELLKISYSNSPPMRFDIFKLIELGVHMGFDLTQYMRETLVPRRKRGADRNTVQH